MWRRILPIHISEEHVQTDIERTLEQTLDHFMVAHFQKASYNVQIEGAERA